MRLLLTTFILFLFVGCSIGTRQYNGTHPKPNLISTLYIDAISRVDGDPRQAGVQIVQIKDAKGKSITFDKRRVDLKPGKYTLYAKWWRLLEDKSYWIVGAGSTLHPIIDGNFIRNPNIYKISFIAKAGMTYVMDVESTMKFFKKYPKKICLTEEKHNAIGVEGPKLNPNIRYVSNNAINIACSE